MSNNDYLIAKIKLLKKKVSNIKSILSKIIAEVDPNSKLAVELSNYLDKIKAEEEYLLFPKLKKLYEVSKPKSTDSDRVKDKKTYIQRVMQPIRSTLQDFVFDINEVHKRVLNTNQVQSPKKPYDPYDEPSNVRELISQIKGHLENIEKYYNKMLSSFENSLQTEDVDKLEANWIERVLKDAEKDIPNLRKRIEQIELALNK